jgi:hypothetical protein
MAAERARRFTLLAAEAPHPKLLRDLGRVDHEIVASLTAREREIAPVVRSPVRSRKRPW